MKRYKNSRDMNQLWYKLRSSINLMHYSFWKYISSIKVLNQILVRQVKKIDVKGDGTICINPNDVVFQVRPIVPRTRYTVCGGKWDKILVPFRNNHRVKSMILHFKFDIEWENTPYYKEILDRNDSDEKRTQERFDRIDSLYNDIKNQGYKKQSDIECGKSSGEIGVCIGRNGGIYWRAEGMHRLTIAQSLDLDEVPVRVLARHKKWQAVRNEIESVDSVTNLSERSQKYIDHPDVKTLL